MIQLKNIERSYKAGSGQTWVLRRINLEIRAGEFITIMGPSGAGKSSLLNALALLDDAGVVFPRISSARAQRSRCPAAKRRTSRHRFP